MSDPIQAPAPQAVVVDGYVPVIDLGLDRPSRPEQRASVVRAVAQACETSGFFVVTGHGVPQRMIDRLHGAARTFFAGPQHVKERVAASPLEPLQHGYSAYGGLEMYCASRLGESEEAQDTRVLVSRNQWPDQPRFREAFLDYYEAVSQLSLKVMGLMASSLGMPADWFDDKFDRHMTPLGINYYPALAEPPPPGALRNEEHTDFGTVTVLHQDDGPGGLQVLDQEGGWLDVPPIPGTFVINLGRLMTMWTNDRWPSTVHRVVMPRPDQIHRDRVSVAFFFQPNSEALIECVPSCADEDSPPRHPGVRSGDYFTARSRRAFVRRSMLLKTQQNGTP
ncbi:2OG-Fe(II) oxygenase family protein [Streptomyces sp. NPDC048428]|uniref:isopenicillin N synthase family dioxygenase n=1 Tax=Streptomyces sp. NPDC048428 TaxID=3154503 RepID=UPI0034151D86